MSAGKQEQVQHVRTTSCGPVGAQIVLEKNTACVGRALSF